MATWRAAKAEGAEFSEAVVREALERLDPLWEELFPAEQARIVQLLVHKSTSSLTDSNCGCARRGSGTLSGSLAPSAPGARFGRDADAWTADVDDVIARPDEAVSNRLASTEMNNSRSPRRTDLLGRRRRLGATRRAMAAGVRFPVDQVTEIEEGTTSDATRNLEANTARSTNSTQIRDLVERAGFA